jgi:hypothetical protein
MDKKTYDEIVGWLKEASTVIEDLDPSIRGDAWDLLGWNALEFEVLTRSMPAVR